MDRLNGHTRNRLADLPAFPEHPNERKAAPRGNGAPKAKAKSSGRFHDLNAFVDGTMAGLTRSELATWFTLFRFVDHKSGTVQASVDMIADRTGTSRQHVHLAIKSLIAKQLLAVVRVGGLNRGSNVYRVVPRPPTGG